MKNTRRFISAVMALAMVSAIAPMSAFAADDTIIKQDTADKTGTMTATYDVTAKYTVTIPASAVIADTEAAATAQPIKAENVLLASGEKVVVTLSEASNTTTVNSTTFNAKNGDSTVKYTIKAGSDTVALGGKVAEFETKAEEQKVDVKFIKDSTSAPTVAGEHTETLTFGISVEDAVVVKTLTVGDVTLDYCDGDTWQQIVDRNPDKIKTTSGSGWEVRISKIDGSFTSWNLCKGSTGSNNYVYADHVVDPNATYVWWE